jgi:hypothetical protein
MLPTFAASGVNAYRNLFRGFTLSSLAGNFKDDRIQLIVWVGVRLHEAIAQLKLLDLEIGYVQISNVIAIRHPCM